jgi:hypothetical protein
MKISLKILALSSIILLAACASTPSNPFLGAWTVNIDTPIGALPGTFNFAEDGTGTMAIEAPGAEGQPPATFQNAAYTDNTVAFSTAIDAGGQSLTLSFTGKVEDDQLSGEFASDFGAMQVTGTRQ